MTSKDDLITLTTSDDPPAAIQFSRSKLVTHSRVFDDMFSLNLKSDSTDPSIPVVETEKELKLFLGVLDEKKRDETIQTLSEKDWKTLAKLADKYQCWSIEKLVEAKAWEAYGKGDARLPFMLATTLGHRELIQATVAEAARSSSYFDGTEELSQEWRARLESYRTAQKAHILDLLQSSLKKCPAHGRKRCTMRDECEGASCWGSIVAGALYFFNLDQSQPLETRPSLSSFSLCSAAKQQLESHADKLDSDVAQWPAFSY
ncbi:uncharacterized protein JCM6883_007484 [Sporobolomyces salmoneus]|uniref:uncharacterized protein n=1 Tax=Sporobolomyces salmoneus TaxID=183962 RepID=UPI00317A7B73